MRLTNSTVRSILFLAVDADRGKIIRQLVAQDTLDEVQVLMDHRRRLGLLRRFLDIEPRPHQVFGVVSQVFLGNSDAGRSDDKSARRDLAVLANSLDQGPQAGPLARRFDLPRYAEMLDRRHINEKASGQRDVRCNSRALSRDRFFSDLDQDLLAFFQQVGDRGLGRTFAITAAIAAVVSFTAVPAAVAVASVPLPGPLSGGRLSGGRLSGGRLSLPRGPRFGPSSSFLSLAGAGRSLASRSRTLPFRLAVPFRPALPRECPWKPQPRFPPRLPPGFLRARNPRIPKTRNSRRSLLLLPFLLLLRLCGPFRPCGARVRRGARSSRRRCRIREQRLRHLHAHLRMRLFSFPWTIYRRLHPRCFLHPRLFSILTAS